MPTTNTQSLVQVSLSPSELAGLVQASLGGLQAHACVCKHGHRGPDAIKGAVMELAWGVQQAELTAYLKTLIPSLPESYGFRLVQGQPDVAAVVTWTA